MFKSGVFQGGKQTISPQDIDNAKAVARRMFEQYDKDRSTNIENYEIPSMIKDTYRIMNKEIEPIKEEIDGYFQILDRNGDGRVTLSDMEALCLRYLCGESIIQTSPTTTSTTFTTIGYQQQHQQLQNMEHYKKAALPTQQQQQPQVFKQYDGTTGINYASPFVRTAIEQATLLFRKYDKDNSGFIDASEIRGLLEDTYGNIGIQRKFTKDDVDSCIRMADTNNDRVISLQEYVTVVLKSLERAGIRF